jgi:hypothetical protein
VLKNGKSFGKPGTLSFGIAKADCAMNILTRKTQKAGSGEPAFLSTRRVDVR